MGMFFLLISLILVPIAVYMFFILRRIVKFWFSQLRRRAVFIISACATILITVGMISLAMTSAAPAVFVLYFLCITLLIDGAYGITCLVMRLTRRFRKREHEHDQTAQTERRSVYSFVRLSGIPALVLCIAVFALGSINMYSIKRTSYEITTSKDISRSYRVALISDLHAGTSLSPSQLEDVVKRINADKPDIVVLAGDIIDESSKVHEITDSLEVLSHLESTYGTYYIYGNHDASSGVSPEAKSALEAGLSKFNVLYDSAVTITDDFSIVGRIDLRMAGASERRSSENIMENTNRDSFILLLDHQPVGYAENSAAGVDLQLSGHTHDGQIFPIGSVQRLFNMNECTYGQYTDGSFNAIVSSGIAGWGLAVRTQGVSEYVIIDIVPETEGS